jgi:hypothetical protein
MEIDVRVWPLASIRCDAAICPELGEKRKWLARVRDDGNRTVETPGAHRSVLYLWYSLHSCSSPYVS